MIPYIKMYWEQSFSQRAAGGSNPFAVVNQKINIKESLLTKLVHR